MDLKVDRLREDVTHQIADLDRKFTDQIGDLDRKLTGQIAGLGSELTEKRTSRAIIHPSCTVFQPLALRPKPS